MKNIKQTLSKMIIISKLNQILQLVRALKGPLSFDMITIAPPAPLFLSL